MVELSSGRFELAVEFATMVRPEGSKDQEGLPASSWRTEKTETDCADEKDDEAIKEGRERGARPYLSHGAAVRKKRLVRERQTRRDIAVVWWMK